MPSWIEKYRIKFSELENERRHLNFEDQNNFNIDKSKYIKVLSLLKLDEIEEPHLNSYYQGSLTVHQGKL